MPSETFGDYTLQQRSGDDLGLTDGEEDISGGVTAEVGNVTSFTVYFGVSEASTVTVTVELSPDGGSTWYEIPEDETDHPVELRGPDSEIVHILYNATNIRLTANNGTPVRAQLREVV